jgi:hypothetical protein
LRRDSRRLHPLSIELVRELYEHVRRQGNRFLPSLGPKAPCSNRDANASDQRPSDGPKRACGQPKLGRIGALERADQIAMVGIVAPMAI